MTDSALLRPSDKTVNHAALALIAIRASGDVSGKIEGMKRNSSL
jgi:hypothetical protein